MNESDGGIKIKTSSELERKSSLMRFIKKTINYFTEVICLTTQLPFSSIALRK
jgi:hypothetical protein